MGSWNGTCMISNLPIKYGDDIKLVMIRKNYEFDKLNLSGGYAYTTDIFTPSFLPISGKYNDYGMIEDIVEDWNSILIEGVLKSMYGNKIITDDESITDWNLVDFLLGIERNELQYTGKPTEEELFRIDIAKSALEVYKDDGYTPKKTIEEYEKVVNVDVNKKLRDVNASFVMIRADIWNHIIDNYVGEFYDRDSKDYNIISAKEWCKKSFNKAIKNKDENHIFNEHGTSSRLLNPTLYDALIKKVKKKDILDDIFKQWSEFKIISAYLSGIRKSWMPQSGAGSQSESWENYKFLAEKIIEISNEEIKEYEEYE